MLLVPLPAKRLSSPYERLICITDFVGLLEAAAASERAMLSSDSIFIWHVIPEVRPRHGPARSGNSVLMDFVEQAAIADLQESGCPFAAPASFF